MCKKKSKTKPQRYAEFLKAMPEGSAKRYLTDRVIPQMDYYSRNSAKNKKRYLVFSVISIVCNAVIPILVLFDEYFEVDFWIKLAVAVISALAGVLTAVAALMSYRELWLKYRLTLERLKGIVDSYMLRTGDFFSIRDDEDKCLNRLEKLCRAEMDEEHRAWEKLVGEDKAEQ